MISQLSAPEGLEEAIVPLHLIAGQDEHCAVRCQELPQPVSCTVAVCLHYVLELVYLRTAQLISPSVLAWQYSHVSPTITGRVPGALVLWQKHLLP